MHMIWHVLCGIFDNIDDIARFINHAKQKMGIDFSNLSSLEWFHRFHNHTLRQYWKKLNDKMNDMIRMTISKTLLCHKISGTSYYKKRIKDKFNSGFVHYPDGNPSRNKLNRFCEVNGRPDLNVSFKKVDVTKKNEPD